MGIAAKIAFVVVVYTALSSHDEKPAFVSRPYTTQAEADEAAEGFPRLPTFNTRVFKIRNGGALEGMFSSFELRHPGKEKDGPDID